MEAQDFAIIQDALGPIYNKSVSKHLNADFKFLRDLMFPKIDETKRYESPPQVQEESMSSCLLDWITCLGGEDQFYERPMFKALRDPWAERIKGLREALQNLDVNAVKSILPHFQNLPEVLGSLPIDDETFSSVWSVSRGIPNIDADRKNSCKITRNRSFDFINILCQTLRQKGFGN